MDTWYGKDKIIHLCVCAVIAYASTEAAIAAALAKEYGDKGNPSNHWCWYDLVADGIGIVLGTIARVLTIHRWSWL